MRELLHRLCAFSVTAPIQRVNRARRVISNPKLQLSRDAIRCAAAQRARDELLEGRGFPEHRMGVGRVARVGGQHDDRDARELGVLPQPREHLRACHHRHHQIQQHEVGQRPRGEHGERLVAAVGEHHREPALLEDGAYGVTEREIVVDDEHGGPRFVAALR
jgi:hypothetical protein